VRAPGHWDDGTWHDVVVTSGRGAVEIHVDGYQVAHAPGSAFLADIAPVARVVVGADLNGKRLFGEVQTAMIYDAALTDAQIKRLAGAVPLSTRALFDTGYHGALSYRIPSLLTLDSGVILAGADQRVSIPNDAPNDINLVMRRSLDGGQTWEEMRTLLSLPGTGALGASLIDSVLVQDHSTGRVICLVDQFPGGIGQPNAVVGTGFDAQGRRVLHNRARELFAVEPDGTVVTAAGEPTDYRVVLSNDAATGARAGDVLLGDEAAGSIYLAYEQAPEDCLFQHRSSHLLMITSDDDGATWSEPIDITAQVKADWMCFLGTGPGNAIQLSAPEHAGRILAPVYYSHEAGGTAYLSCAAICSDDGGATGTWYTHPQRAYANPTSEFNSHLAVHNDQVEHRGVGVQAVIHAQPPYLVQLSHIKAIRSTKEFNRRILRWEPETIVQIPAGIEVLDFMVPGSQTLMENNVRALRDHVIVLWSKHGIMVRSDDSPLAAVDKVEYAETGAMYEVRNMMAGGLGEGVTDAELRAVVEAFGVDTDLF